VRRLLLVLAAGVVLGGCGDSGANHYSGAQIKAAYYRASDGGPGLHDYYVDEDFHSHTNYVPVGGLEVCPLAQRSNAPAAAPNAIEPTAAQPVAQFVVEPEEATNISLPSITQGALVFGTSTIAGNGMRAFSTGVSKCPSSYTVTGGPSPILGTYSVNARPLKTSGWDGYTQQIAHTYPAGEDDVYYEDMAHVVLHRANVILYLDLVQKRVIGQRSNSAAKAERAVQTVLKRLG
jgi:hypothetical protein